MYFKPMLIEKILSGKKTMTRRLIKLHSSEWTHDDRGNRIEVQESYCQYKVGKSYAVCPKRGQSTVWWRNIDGTAQQAHLTTVHYSVFMPELNGLSYVDYARRIAGDEWQNWLTAWGFKPLRIRIAAIRQEDSRHISHADAQAEGFQVRGDFLKLWIEMHDPTLYRQLIKRMGPLGYIATDGLWSMRWVEDEELAGMLIKRPADLYSAWAIKFKREG